MTLSQIVTTASTELSSHNIAVVIFIVLSLIEITPIKICPFSAILGWMGKKMTQSIQANIDALKTENEQGLTEVRHNIADIAKAVNMTKIDLQNHIAESMRREILDFQNSCLHKTRHTREEWAYVHKLCDKYETHVKENGLKNSEVEEAIEYIRRIYRRILEDRDFIELLDQETT